MQCVDEDDLTVFGDYNSYKAQQFNVQFVKCHDKPYCKRPDEITEFLKNKFFVILYN